MKLHWQIAIAMVVGGVAGTLSGPESVLYGDVAFLDIYEFLGEFFVRALSMLVVPLIVSSILSGILGLGNSQGLGRLGSRAASYYVLTSILAILTGLLLVNVIEPGILDGVPVANVLGLSTSADEATVGIMKSAGFSVREILLRLIPKNPIEVAAKGEILPLLVFTILIGVFVGRLRDELRSVQARFWQAIFSAMMGITGLVMKLAPIGVFGLISKIAATSGYSAVKPLAWYMLTVALALAIHAGITLPVLLAVIGRVRPFRLYRAQAPALLTAFSTASSSATLPVSMECLEKRAGVSNRVSSLVLPLGATVNMDGTALYECVAAMFIAQAYGVELGFGAQSIVVLTSLLASIGAAGIPSAGLVMLAVVLKSAGLPLEGVGIILAVDRILDMARTSVNVMSDSVCATIVARGEGENPLSTNV